MGRPVSDRMASLAGIAVPRRSVAVLALLSALLGIALSGGLAGERSSPLGSASSRAVSRKGLTSLPSPAQGPVSAALGAADHAYRVISGSGGFSAASPAQRLSERFGRAGVHLSSGAVQLTVGLRSVGYGSSSEAVDSVTPQVSANRVLYRHAGLSEWYANGPLGVEQGFTLERAPAAHHAGPLTLSLALAGNARATLAPGGQSITLSHPSAPTLRYGDLSATDARGRTVRSWLELRSGRILIDLDTRGASFPLRIDPLLQQGKKLVAGEIGEGHFGQSVALSADGNTALVGAPTGNGEAGAAWVFTRSGSTWTEQEELRPASGEESDDGGFGSSVALSPDGKTALVGAPGDGTKAGAAWVFTRSEAGTWTQQGEKLTAKAGEEAGEGQFGFSVGLSSKGNTALIGAPDDSTKAGAAWVFTRSEAGVWTQQGGKLAGGEEAGEGQFGFSVGLSSEGNTALIGGPGDSSKSGAAWVFARSGETWSQQKKLAGGEESEDGEFGSSVSLSSEGNTALIGGPGDSEGAGAAWVFALSEGLWSQQGAKLTAKSGEESKKGAFGSSVALSAEGNTALVGGPGDEEAIGAAWMLTRSAEGIWSQQGGKVTAKSGEEIEKGAFGASVALSFDGNTELVGGPADSSGAGAVWGFVNPPSVTNVNPDKGPEGGGTAVTVTGANLNGATDVQFGSSSATSFKVVSASTITAVAPAGAGAGTVDVSVTTSGGTSAAGSTDKFRYVPPPTVLTEAASAIAQTTATLNATVNPNGGDVSSCSFEYGTSEAYEFSVPCSSLPGSGTEPVAVSAALKSLIADTTYYFRVSATNIGGTSTDILEAKTFKTLPNAPTVVTEEASSIAQTTTTVNATVNPNGGEVTSCEFDYGTSDEYGKSVPCSSLPSSETEPAAVSATLKGLTADTTYHFRIVATNPGGTGKGADRTFKTLPNPPTVGSVNPSEGPQGGGTAVTITGTNLSGATAVKFGSSSATSFKVNSATSITAVSPAGTGTVHVTVSTPGGTSAPSEADEFSYVPLPAVTGVSPGEGPEGGGTAVTITGTDLSGATVVKFGSADATGVEVTSETTITALAPAGSGTVHVTVSTPGGTSATSGADEFRYVPPPTVTGVSPNAGPTAGGSTVTITGTSLGKATAVKFGTTAATGVKVNSPTSITAVSPAGSGTVDVRVSTVGGTSATGPADRFNYVPPPTAVTKAASVIAQTTTTVNATVNPNGGEVTSCSFEYGTTEAYGKSAPCSSLPGSGGSPVAVSASLKGLSANTTYHFRILATNAGGTGEGADETFKTLPDAPAVLTEAASSIAQTAATLNATVNPNGGPVSDCRLEYGATASYGSSVSCTPSPGAGESPVAVSAKVTGLSANTTYHFRVLATNAGGTSTGSDVTFKTLPNPPTALTKAASSITKTTATLNASVNPNGGEVSSCELEYGPTEAYGSRTTCSPAPGSGSSPVPVAGAITGLSANTTYHFRVVATNAGGTGVGNDATFKTLPDPPTVATVSASSITQTTATLNASVNPNGGEVSGCELEYGSTEAYGSKTTCSPSPGAGASPVAVSGSATGLVKSTAYHFRIVATNAGGTSTGADETFETAPGPPTVIAGEPSSIGQTSALLNAEINPNGGTVNQCYFHFEDVTTSEVVITPCVGLPLSGKSLMKVSALAEGLKASTRYRFSLEVINSFAETEFAQGSAPFETLPGPEVITGTASQVTQTSATLNATVNPNGGEVSSCEFEYGTSEAYGSKPVPCEALPGEGKGDVAVSAKLQGLSTNTKYFFRIVATNPGGTSKDTLGQTFTTLPNPPTVVTATAMSPTQTAATVTGTVNPNGGTVSDCRFEYGTSTAYGSSASCLALPGSGSSAVQVSGAPEALKANTTYHFRILATNAGGTGTGSDQTFKTLPNAPTVLTGAASSSTQTTVTLNATVNPNESAVSDCHFEYGNSTAYGISVPCTELPGSGDEPAPVSASVKGLSQNTTYHFRIVATNGGGVGHGSDAEFTTPANPPSDPGSPGGSTAAPSTGVLATGIAPPPVDADPPADPPPTCKVSLASQNALEQSQGAVAIKLSWTGAGAESCSGKLTVKLKGAGRRGKPTVIATGIFSLPPDRVRSVKLRLTAAGQALVRSSHGHINASLTVLKVLPGPSQALTEVVHLMREPQPSASKAKRP
jgi:phosphodiesterase/alkaline phosphatase D-like protein